MNENICRMANQTKRIEDLARDFESTKVDVSRALNDIKSIFKDFETLINSSEQRYFHCFSLNLEE